MEQKKHDLRDDIKNKAASADTHAQMAGETDLGPTPLKPQTDMHAVMPDLGKHLAEGQVTKSN